MSTKLRTHLAQRIFSRLKPSPEAVNENLSPYMYIGNAKGSHEFNISLPRRILEGMGYKISQLLQLPSDDLIKSVQYVEDNYKTFVAFNLHQKAFIEDVLVDFPNSKFTVPQKQRIMVEYSSPNIAKPFHLGHLRSTIIGNFVANVNMHAAHDVTRLNYLGDWGTQFGFLHVGVDLLNLKEEQIRRNPIQLLYKAYVTANELAVNDPEVTLRARRVFTELERGEFKDVERWQQFREYTVGELERVYQRLGVSFDRYAWESMYGVKEIDAVIGRLEGAGLLRDDQDGRRVFDYGQRTVPVVKSDGSSLYVSRDIAAALDRYETEGFDRMIYVVDNAQTDHFVALKEMLTRLDSSWEDRMQHLKFGRIRGMSTRKGTVVFLKDILDETRDVMLQKQIDSRTTRVSTMNDDVADVLGISCVIVNDLKQRRQRDYQFDWNRALQVNGDSGIKLQYTHCRLVSLENNCEASLPETCEPSLLVGDPNALALIYQIARYHDALRNAYEDLEACILVIYLFQLCKITSRALKVLKIKNEEPNLASQRLLLFHIARLVLREGMEILGLRPLNQM